MDDNKLEQWSELGCNMCGELNYDIHLIEETGYYHGGYGSKYDYQNLSTDLRVDQDHSTESEENDCPRLPPKYVPLRGDGKVVKNLCDKCVLSLMTDRKLFIVEDTVGYDNDMLQLPSNYMYLSTSWLRRMKSRLEAMRGSLELELKRREQD